jgi:6-phosphogluconate dehydrogenase
MSDSVTDQQRISPLAGRPAPKELLIDVAQLEREYYDRKPDISEPTERLSFGTSGHRGSTAELGYLHCGPSGAGHFVKMVHNGIEYGLMAAYVEGLSVLRAANAGNRPHHIDAETAPLRNPEHYRYELDLRDISEAWRRGSVIASWLLDLTTAALAKDPELSEFSGRVADSGEGRWTITAAIDEAVPIPVLTTALYQRFSSRGGAAYQARLLSAMRFEFGGHVESVS